MFVVHQVGHFFTRVGIKHLGGVLGNEFQGTGVGRNVEELAEVEISQKLIFLVDHVKIGGAVLVPVSFEFEQDLGRGLVFPNLVVMADHEAPRRLFPVSDQVFNGLPFLGTHFFKNFVPGFVGMLHDDVGGGGFILGDALEKPGQVVDIQGILNFQAAVFVRFIKQLHSLLIGIQEMENTDLGFHRKLMEAAGDFKVIHGIDQRFDLFRGELGIFKIGLDFLGGHEISLPSEVKMKYCIISERANTIDLFLI